MFDYLRAQQSPVGKSTVYRCLDRLVSQGRARRYFLGDGARACYQYVDGQGACREHFHLKCLAADAFFLYHASAWTRLPHMCWSTTDFRLTIQKPYCMALRRLRRQTEGNGGTTVTGFLKRAAALLCAAVLLAGCGAQPLPPENERIEVVATLFPQYDFARQIAGARADVTLLLPPGVESHAYEPTPADIIRINQADVFLYTGAYMEPWAQKLIEGLDGDVQVVDVSGACAA